MAGKYDSDDLPGVSGGMSQDETNALGTAKASLNGARSYVEDAEAQANVGWYSTREGSYYVGNVAQDISGAAQDIADGGNALAQGGITSGSNIAQNANDIVSQIAADGGNPPVSVVQQEIQQAETEMSQLQTDINFHEQNDS